MKKNTLYLLPTPLTTTFLIESIPHLNLELTLKCPLFVVENTRSARRFLRTLDPSFPIDDKIFMELNEQSKDPDLQEIFKTFEKYQNGILMSEAGCPGIADPGASLVRKCHDAGIAVHPLPGPSSVIMAVMGSGLNGQSFSFLGYLPKEKEERRRKIKTLSSLAQSQSVWFIETPYRNLHLTDDLLSQLPPSMLLCVATELQSPHEFVRTLPLSKWKQMNLDFLKDHPAIFGLGY